MSHLLDFFENIILLHPILLWWFFDIHLVLRCKKSIFYKSNVMLYLSHRVNKIHIYYYLLTYEFEIWLNTTNKQYDSNCILSALFG
jgi:hypothetical protein